MILKMIGEGRKGSEKRKTEEKKPFFALHEKERRGGKESESNLIV